MTEEAKQVQIYGSESRVYDRWTSTNERSGNRSESHMFGRTPSTPLTDFRLEFSEKVNVIWSRHFESRTIWGRKDNFETHFCSASFKIVAKIRFSRPYVKPVQPNFIIRFRVVASVATPLNSRSSTRSGKVHSCYQNFRPMCRLRSQLQNTPHHPRICNLREGWEEMWGWRVYCKLIVWYPCGQSGVYPLP